jgi:hypothetical protein
VIVAQTENGAEIRRDVEDILQMKRVGFDADAGRLLERRGGTVADIGIEERDGRDGERDVAGGAAADLVVALEDGADEQAVGVAGDGLLDREVETVAKENVVAVDEREGAAGDVLGDGVPRVAFFVAPFEELGGDVGIVAQLDFGREAEVGAEAIEGLSAISMATAGLTSLRPVRTRRMQFGSTVP